jgi:threonine dehydrogenase-like Zn-dependent dehydrogenase
MASVAVSAVRKSGRIELGGASVVVGLGLVGNFAAQLLQLAGMRVVGVDLVEERVRMAAATGLRAEKVSGENGVQVVEGVLGGKADVVVEASGVPDALSGAVKMVRDGGEVIVLGTPRGSFTGDATELFAEVHYRGLHLIGALEWLLPLETGAWQARWSLYEDYVTLFDLFRTGAIRTGGLVVSVEPPTRAQEIYSRLADRDPGLGAVVFDWRGESERLSQEGRR